MRFLTKGEPKMHTVGEYITEELEVRGWTRLYLSRVTRLDLSDINSIIAGEHTITPDVARVLSAAFGTSTWLWMNLAAAQKEAEALKQERDQLLAEQHSGPWRVGGKVTLNVYEGDRPMFQCHTPEDAARIVTLLNREQPSDAADDVLRGLHNALLDVRVDESSNMQDVCVALFDGVTKLRTELERLRIRQHLPPFLTPERLELFSYSLHSLSTRDELRDLLREWAKWLRERPNPD